jgi:hypothetical protein
MISVSVDIVKSNGCEEYGKVNIKEIGAPSSSLMLRDTGYDGNVFLRIGRV